MAAQNVSALTGLQYPRHLFGRQKESGILQDVFRRVCAGRSEVVTVMGHAGTGKTALVNGVVMPMALRSGYFGSGKCSQFNPGVPYSPIVQAFDKVAAQVLTESRDSFDTWRKKLFSALGPNGALISEVIPRFKPIIGPQPVIEALQPLEAQNRFRMVFRKLVRIFSTREHPLALFLDDLQWADPATLELIRYLIDDNDQGYLLLVGAYRDDTVTDDHPLANTLDTFRRQRLSVTEIPMDDLSIDDTYDFIAGALGISGPRAKLLSEQLYRRTGGNPLFLMQILRLLQDNKILKYSAPEGWAWDTDSLADLDIPEDVVSLMTAKLMKLPKKSGDLIKMAACVGNTFDVKTLSIACEKDEATVKAGLRPAILAGVILPCPDSEPGREAYEFLHDRVHQAAYSMIPCSQNKELHLRLGRLLFHNMTGDSLDESISLIMNHCNRGIGLITDGTERLAMAENNLAAARKSKNSAAYQAACEFLNAGIALLPENSWRKHYRLTFDLHLELAACKYLVGNIEEADRLCDLAAEYAETDVELAAICNLKMVMYAGLGKRADAVPFGIRALSLLGVKLPANPGKTDILMEILHIKLLLLGRKPKDLLQLPEMNDPVKKNAMKMMSLLGSITNFICPNLYVLLLLKGTVLALRLGNSEMSAVAYAVYAVILGEVLGDYHSALGFEKLSVELAEKYNSAYAKCITYFVTGALVSHWTQPSRVSLDYLLKSVENGMQSGELLYTGYSIHLIIEEMYLMGMPMADVDSECKKWHGFVRQMKLDFVLAFLVMLRRQIRTLGGLKEDALDIRMDDDAENEFLDHLSQGETEVRHYFFDMQLCYLSGRYGQAMEIAAKIEKTKFVLSGFMHSWVFRFYYSLTITALYATLPNGGKRKYRAILNGYLREIKKLSNLCPENFRYQYFLLCAEEARIDGRGEKAMTLYDLAIASAREQGNKQVEAIANELAARFHLSMGRNKIATVYLSEAIRLYGIWGAWVKSKAMQNEFAALLSDSGDEFRKDAEPAGPRFERIKEGRSEAESDTAAMKKAQYIIQRDPEKQLEDILDVLFEYAGAGKGYLILESDGELYVEAAKTRLHATTQAIDLIPMEKITDLSHVVVRYVARTQETLVLGRGGQDGIFIRDPYLAENRTATVLCMPFLFQGLLAGVVYLESSLGVEQLQPERLETIRLLCDKIAYTKRIQSYFESNKTQDAGRKSQPDLDELTARELTILELIASGMSNKEIAENLVLSSNTIKMHISNIYGKLQVQRRVQAVNRAKELGVLALAPAPDQNI